MKDVSSAYLKKMNSRIFSAIGHICFMLLDSRTEIPLYGEVKKKGNGNDLSVLSFSSWSRAYNISSSKNLPQYKWGFSHCGFFISVILRIGNSEDVLNNCQSMRNIPKAFWQVSCPILVKYIVHLCNAMDNLHAIILSKLGYPSLFWCRMRYWHYFSQRNGLAAAKGRWRAREMRLVGTRRSRRETGLSGRRVVEEKRGNSPIVLYMLLGIVGWNRVIFVFIRE